MTGVRLLPEDSGEPTQNCGGVATCGPPDFGATLPAMTVSTVARLGMTAERIARFPGLAAWTAFHFFTPQSRFDFRAMGFFLRIVRQPVLLLVGMQGKCWARRCR